MIALLRLIFIQKQAFKMYTSNGRSVTATVLFFFFMNNKVIFTPIVLLPIAFLTVPIPRYFYLYISVLPPSFAEPRISRIERTLECWKNGFKGTTPLKRI